MNKHILTKKYQQQIMTLSKQLGIEDIEGIDIFAIFIYLNNGDFALVANSAPATEEYIASGLCRGDISNTKTFREHNRVIFSQEYTELDPVQNQILDIAKKHNFYRVYSLSRFCSDCSLHLCAEQQNQAPANPQEVYAQTVDQFETFCCKFLDNAMNIFIEELPQLAGTRFATDAFYREHVIKKRALPQIKPLSHSEINVLYWAAQGKTAEETSMLLGLTKHTLETYRKRAIKKLGASNLTHAVYLAQQHGIIV